MFVLSYTGNGRASPASHVGPELSRIWVALEQACHVACGKAVTCPVSVCNPGHRHSWHCAHSSTCIQVPVRTHEPGAKTTGSEPRNAKRSVCCLHCQPFSAPISITLHRMPSLVVHTIQILLSRPESPADLTPVFQSLLPLVQHPPHPMTRFPPAAELLVALRQPPLYHTNTSHTNATHMLAAIMRWLHATQHTFDTSINCGNHHLPCLWCDWLMCWGHLQLFITTFYTPNSHQTGRQTRDWAPAQLAGEQPQSHHVCFCCLPCACGYCHHWDSSQCQAAAEHHAASFWCMMVII